MTGAENTKEFDLNFHTARLLMSEPFFAAISRRVNKRASFGIPTAGVMVNKETAQFEMLYNPKFFQSLSDSECSAVLIHEFYHIIFRHVTDRAPWNKESDVDARLWNICTDLAINSHISGLPDSALVPAKEGTPFEHLPLGMAAEWYIPEVKKILEKDGNAQGDDKSKQSGDGSDDTSTSSSALDSFDDHSGWGSSSDGQIEEIANERLKEIIKSASEECAASNSWGSISSSVRKEILKGIETKIDWRKVLRFFIKSSQKTNKTSTIRRINRRYPYIHAGRKSNRVANIAVSIDQSGSVDDSMLSMFFAELNKLSEIASFTVIPFDTRVDESKVYQWRKGEARKVERVLHGGTCFDAPTEYVNAGNFDGHIVLTDMCAPKPKPSKCQRMWMTTREHSDRRYFTTSERVVTVD